MYLLSLSGGHKECRSLINTEIKLYIYTSHEGVIVVNLCGEERCPLGGKLLAVRVLSKLLWWLACQGIVYQSLTEGELRAIDLSGRLHISLPYIPPQSLTLFSKDLHILPLLLGWDLNPEVFTQFRSQETVVFAFCDGYGKEFVNWPLYIYFSSNYFSTSFPSLKLMIDSLWLAVSWRKSS